MQNYHTETPRIIGDIAKRIKQETQESIRRITNKQLSKTKRNPAETTNISLSGGQGETKFVSTNVDDAGARAKRVQIMNRISHIGADTARIQDTHGAITTTSNVARYVIYQGRAAIKTAIEEEQTDQKITPQKT